MQLTPNALNATSQATRRFDAIDMNFAQFMQNVVAFYGNPQCHVPGVGVVTEQAAMSLTYRGTRIRLQLVASMTPELKVFGRVVCTLVEPAFKSTAPILGGFTFTPTGETDFEPSPFGNSISIDSDAAEIALYFVHLALMHDVMQ